MRNFPIGEQGPERHAILPGGHLYSAQIEHGYVVAEHLDGQPIDSNPIGTDTTFERAMTRIREAVQAAQTANTGLEAATDDLTDEVYPPYDGDGEPV